MVFGNNQRLEGFLPVPGNLDGHRPVIASRRFNAFPVAPIRPRLFTLVVFLVSKMLRQFRFHGPLDRRPGELLHDAFQLVKIVGTVVVLQNLIQRFFCKGRTCSLR
jgi:hypothetical protein